MGGPQHLGGPLNHDSGREVAYVHVPVLLQQVGAFLEVQPGGTFVDGTVGGGGHAEAILTTSSPDGRLLGLDQDPTALELAAKRLIPFGERVILRHGSFADLNVLAEGFTPADGVLMDLGLSSHQLADSARGFTFSREGPLDMRFDPTESGPTASDLVNGLSVKELADLLYRYGEVGQARQVAEAIVAARPLHTTVELREVVGGVVRRRGRIHPATRVFQALRIAVNRELEALEAALPQALDILRPGGRLVVISFHSLEDRIVKRFLQQEARDCICPPEMPACACDHRSRVRILTRRPLRPGAGEVSANPRARSARLRAAEKK